MIEVVYGVLWGTIVALGWFIMQPQKRVVFGLLNALLFSLLFVGIFYNPIKKSYDDQVHSTQKDYKKYNKSIIENDTLTDIFKTAWLSALDNRNKYYIYMLILLIFLSVPYVMVCIIMANTSNGLDMLESWIPLIALVMGLVGLLWLISCIVFAAGSKVGSFMDWVGNLAALSLLIGGLCLIMLVAFVKIYSDIS